MKIKQAIKKIVQNWEKLKDAEGNDTYNMPSMIAVWCAKSNKAESGYETDEEWIGITPQGNIAWAYASGCSCWRGDFDENRFASVKEVTLNHDNAPEQWERAIISFAETGVMQEL